MGYTLNERGDNARVGDREKCNLQPVKKQREVLYIP